MKMSYVPFPERLGCLVKTHFEMSPNYATSTIPRGKIGLIVRCWPVSSDPHARPFFDVLLGGEIFTLDIGLFKHI